MMSQRSMYNIEYPYKIGERYKQISPKVPKNIQLNVSVFFQHDEISFLFTFLSLKLATSVEIATTIATTPIRIDINP